MMTDNNNAYYTKCIIIYYVNNFHNSAQYVLLKTGIQTITKLYTVKETLKKKKKNWLFA